MTVTIQNADRLLRKLRKLPEAAKAEIRKALAAQADEVIDMMKRLVPVDEGDLRDSIAWRWGRTAPKGSVAVGRVAAGTRSELSITIFAGGNQAFWARYVEFGTRKMRAQPFFFPAWRSNRKHVRRKVQAAMRKVARQVASSG